MSGRSASTPAMFDDTRTGLLQVTPPSVDALWRTSVSAPPRSCQAAWRTSLGPVAMLAQLGNPPRVGKGRSAIHPLPGLPRGSDPGPEVGSVSELGAPLVAAAGFDHGPLRSPVAGCPTGS